MPQWWLEIVSTVRDELSDVADLSEFTRIVFRLTVAVVLGAAIGYDRERHERPAGLRTHMLVALGAATFVLVPVLSGHSPDQMGRIIQGIIAGIGFLGAGTILKLDSRQKVRGLTTAASIWATASIAVAVGLGHLVMAMLATALALVVLAVLPYLESRKYP